MSSTADSTYLLLYGGRYRRVIRVLALTVLTVAVATSRPRPTLHGDGLVILLSLVVTITTQVSMVFGAPGRESLIRALLDAVAAGVLVGYDPTVATAILLAFAGLDAGANLDLTPGMVVTGAAVVAVALGDLAGNRHRGYVSLGTVAVAGFLAATTRKEYVLRAEEAELRLVEVERAREEHALAVSLAARASAAREVHDILAHSLGALVLQLDALDALMGGESPDRARSAEVLGRARALAVDGLTEARRAVGSLRDDPPSLVDSLRQLGDSYDNSTVDVTGIERPTPDDVTLALRRTAQEGLSNAAKHAPGAPARVHLAFGPHDIVLTVCDGGRADGAPPAALAGSGGGYGLEGLRERAELIGGTLAAGREGSGWKIQLTVPDRRAPVERGATGVVDQ